MNNKGRQRMSLKNVLFNVSKAFSCSSDLCVKDMPFMLTNRCSSPIVQLAVNTCSPPIMCDLIFWRRCRLCGSSPALNGGNSTEADCEKQQNDSNVSTGEKEGIDICLSARRGSDNHSVGQTPEENKPFCCR